MALWTPNTIGFGVLSLSDVTDVSSAVSDLRATADNLHFSPFLARSCCVEIDYIYAAFFIFVSLFTFIIWMTGVCFKPFCFPAGMTWRWVNHVLRSLRCTLNSIVHLYRLLSNRERGSYFNTVCHRLNSSLIKHVRSVTLKSALFIVDYVWACSFWLNSALTFWLNVC